MIGTLTAALALTSPAPLWATFPGKTGPGKGKTVVLLAGDDEYRSEDMLTQMGKILADRHGFTCHVIYPIAPDGTIHPPEATNMPGVELLDKADLLVIYARFRNLKDEQMMHVDRYVKSGKPIVGFRTSTHAFQVPAGQAYARYDWQSKEWPGGFGKQILGETWLSHHGQHLVQSTLSQRAPEQWANPILQGVGPIWVPSDVYEVYPPKDATILLYGTVLRGMKMHDMPVRGAKNNPLMPVVWTRELGRQRIFTSTMGAGVDYLDPMLRRLSVNACYWALRMRLPQETNADLVGAYNPSPIGFESYRRGQRPGEL